MRGIYLETPDGDIIAELHYDVELRARQRWYRPWYPYPDPEQSADCAESVSCNPSNPSKLCQS